MSQPSITHKATLTALVLGLSSVGEASFDISTDSSVSGPIWLTSNMKVSNMHV
jgi:hypothetical protein